MILEPAKIKSVTVSTVSPSICHEVMGPDAMILVFWILSYTLSNRTLWWQPCRLCPSSTSVTSRAIPWGRSPALWSISLCNRFSHLYVHIKASRTDNHLFSQKEWGTVIPQSFIRLSVGGLLGGLQSFAHLHLLISLYSTQGHPKYNRLRVQRCSMRPPGRMTPPIMPLPSERRAWYC